MLKSHLSAIELVLIAQSQAASNAGHPNLRGGPREWFLSDFLSSHLPSTLEVGQGEVIDAMSLASPTPNEYRPQVDIVLYRRDLPKITYSPGHQAYLAEGVLATIEVKSTLTKEELRSACLASHKHKTLHRENPGTIMSSGGWLPMSIVSYVVAYEGPAQISTVTNWLTQLRTEISIPGDHLIDVIVILGKGVVWQVKAFPTISPEPNDAHATFGYIAQSERNLFFLFSHMLSWMANASSPPSLDKYSENAFGEANYVSDT